MLLRDAVGYCEGPGRITSFSWLLELYGADAANLVDQLTERDRSLIHTRYEAPSDSRSYSALASKHGLSRERVQQLVHQALERLAWAIDIDLARRQYKLVLGGGEGSMAEVPIEALAAANSDPDLGDEPVNTSVRSVQTIVKLLRRAGFAQLGGLTAQNSQQIAAIKNFGSGQRLSDLRGILRRLGLSLAGELRRWAPVVLSATGARSSKDLGFSS
jgi:hypothetical protein